MVANVQELFAFEVLRRYKSLADIERGFKILKSEIEISAVFRRLQSATGDCDLPVIDTGGAQRPLRPLAAPE